jgi:hypothetical protein
VEGFWDGTHLRPLSVMIVILIIGIVVDGLFTKLDLPIRNRRGCSTRR